MTTRVRLGTAVLLPALRHPVVLAQQLANIDQISQGRLVLGLGVGWSLPSAEREWAACGADHKARVRRLQEHIEIWRRLWTGQPVTHHGSDLDLVDHTIGPLPWRPEGPPILITAGNRGELLPGSDSGVSLVGTLGEQLARGRDGGLLSPDSQFWQMFGRWSREEPLLVLGGTVSAVWLVVRLRRRPAEASVGLAALCLWLFLGRGGIVLPFYLVPVLPLLALGYLWTGTQSFRQKFRPYTTVPDLWSAGLAQLGADERVLVADPAWLNLPAQLGIDNIGGYDPSMPARWANLVAPLLKADPLYAALRAADPRPSTPIWSMLRLRTTLP